MNRIRFLNLSVPQGSDREAFHRALDDVLEHGQLIGGPELVEFEQRVAAFCGRAFALGVSSGTDALYLGLRSLGVSAGDEVITTPMSFVATGHSILFTCAEPVFADIGDDLNLDPECLDAAWSPRTRALVVVHLNGKLCRMEPILAWARERGVMVVEDASQAFGATYQGKPAGAFGELGCFSLNSMKVLAAVGEAGIIVGDGAATLERLKQMRYMGIPDRESAYELTSNHRLDTLQAAFLLHRLERLESSIARRRAIATTYHRELAGVVELPLEEEGYRDCFYTYTIRCDRRNELQSYLEERGIETRVRHPLLIPDHPYYRGKFRGDTPRARRLVERMLCIPCHDKLEDEEVARVAQGIRGFYGAN